MDIYTSTEARERAEAEQRAELATSKKRLVKLTLTDSDCERLLAFASDNRVTLEEILENYIADLICGTRTNGSDERMLAQEYFDRWHSCYWNTNEEQSLLKHLLKNSELDKYLEGMECSQEDTEERIWGEMLMQECLEGFTLAPGRTMEQEQAEIKAYAERVDEFMNGIDQEEEKAE